MSKLNRSHSTSTPSSPLASNFEPNFTGVNTANLFRNLIFSGSIPLCINIADDDLPSGSDRVIESYYIQVPRISYLPLLLAQIRAQFLQLILSDSTIIPDDQLWFDYDGIPLRWHWTIGLLFDYHTCQSTLPISTSPSTKSIPPERSRSTSLASTNLPLTNQTKKLPFKITLHLKDPPMEALLMGPSLDLCRSGFMNRLKESDYLRWGSVKRMTNLKREQQDSLWEAVNTNDLEKYWNVANKLLPLPPSPSIPNSISSISLSPSLNVNRSPTPNSLHDGRPSDGNSVRNVPIRIYLPEPAPTIQDLFPPTVQGQPMTLLALLQKTLPLLFPVSSSTAMVPKGSISITIQGISIPLDTELGWLGACLVGTDGWVNCVLDCRQLIL